LLNKLSIVTMLLAKYIMIASFIRRDICNFVMMTTLTVNINNKKTEKALKAILDALDLNYTIEHPSNSLGKSLTFAEDAMFNRLKRSAEEIKLYKDGKIELQDAMEFLNEL